MDIIISVSGAIIAIIVAVLGAVLANKNSNLLQLRKLKEQHYVSYIEALHDLATDNNLPENMIQCTLYRDKLFIVASEEIVRHVIDYENKGVGQDSFTHDEHLTNLVKVIRKDLKLKSSNFPTVSLKKNSKN